MIFDDHLCELGEGAFWHPERAAFFWFDILNKKLYSKEKTFSFEYLTSAAGWVSKSQLMVASEVGLHLLDLETEQLETITDLEKDNPITRSNDGRADPWGGFWIGTMGLSAQAEAGAIYRYFRGEVRQLFDKLTIPNAICFCPNRQYAYFTDTVTQKVFRQKLSNTDGWPQGDPEVWLDLTATDFNPDGAVVDADSHFWNAQWGANRVACYDANAQFVRAVKFEASQTSCPSFGGENLTDLFVTSAREGLEDAATEHDGMVFVEPNVAQGQKEHQVIL